MTAFPMRAQRRFDTDARSVAAARRFVRAQLEEWGAPELLESAALAVSELVTNAVVHTGTAPLVELKLDVHNLRIEVEDRHPGRALPTGVTVPADEAESGRGLMITSSLASSWGVEYTPVAKRVWLVCDRDSAPPSDTAPFRESGAVAAGSSAVAVVELSGDGVVVGWNSDATSLFGWTPDQVLGRTFRELVDPVPGERAPEGPPARGALWQGTYAVLRPDGTPVPAFASHLAAPRGDGSVLLLVPEAWRRLLEHPRAAAPSRPGPSDPDPLGLRDDALLRLGVEDYLPLAVERVRDAVGADASYLLLSHDFDEAYEVAAVSGLRDSLRHTGMSPGDPGSPDARTPHLPVLIKDGAATQVSLLSGTDLESLVVVPVVAEGQVVGALAAASEGRNGFSDDQCVLLQRLADSIALAADRARLQTSERQRRGWLSFVAEAGDLLAATLDQDMTMAITGQILVPRIATWCAVHLDDERGVPVLQQVWHADEQQVEALRQVLEATAPEDLGHGGDPFDDEVTTMRLVARGQPFGFLTLGRPPGNPLRDDVLLVAESISRRAALAIDNARSHGALQAIGQALQDSLLPPSTPSMPGFEVGVVYEPAGEATAAGGDFYDLFPLEGGSWCFVVGDVCGTGAEAAAVTGLARHTIRALVRAGFPIAPTLERPNDAIVEEGERSRFMTLACGTLRQVGRTVHLTMVNAGHPPPFVVGREGAVRQIGTPQPLLGVLDKVEYVAEEHVLERGDLIVTVTDGVLERRDGERMLDDDGVAAELARAGDLPAQAVAERLRRLVVDFTDAPQIDDMAILAIRVDS
ncbi:MAG: SpoIIE family protein phosphatase [Actinomycetes bacterium]